MTGIGIQLHQVIAKKPNGETLYTWGPFRDRAVAEARVATNYADDRADGIKDGVEYVVFTADADFFA